MGVNIGISGANFYNNSVGFALPVERAIKGLFFLWDDLDRAVINHVPGPDLVVRGTPVMNSHYAECTGLANYFETSIYEVDEMTVIAACWNPDALAAGTPMYVGNYQGAAQAPNGSLTSAGFGLYSSSSSNIRGLAARLNAGAADSPVTTVGEAASALNFYSFRARDTQATSLKAWGTGTRTNTSGPSFMNPRLPNIMPFRIGSGHTTWAGKANVSIVAIYHTLLTNAEELAVVTALAAELAAQKSVYVAVTPD